MNRAAHSFRNASRFPAHSRAPLRFAMVLVVTTDEISEVTRTSAKRRSERRAGRRREGVA